MWTTSFINIMIRAASLWLESMGMTVTSLLVGLSVIAATALNSYQQHGMEGIKRQIGETISLGVIVTAGLWFAIFLFCLARAIYNDHRTLVNANEEKLTTIDNQKNEIEGLKKTIGELSKAKPQVNDAEVARLRGELDQREKKKVIRAQISKLVEEGDLLRTSLYVNEERP